MSHRGAVLLGLLLAAAAPLQGQGQGNALRGQVLMPNGGTPSRELRVVLYSADGLRQQDIGYTDSNGRFVMLAVPDGDYRIRVDSEGDEFQSTDLNVQVNASSRYIVITLRPPVSEPMPQVSLLDAETPQEAAKAYRKGVERLERKDLGGARKNFEKAIRLHPDFFEASNDLGMLHLQEQRFSEAEGLFRKALELRREDFRPRYNLGVCLLRQEKYNEALPLLERVVREEPEYSSAHYYLGVALYAFQELDRAQAQLTEAYRLDPQKEVEALMFLGNVHYLKGDLVKAIESFEDYLKALPDAPNAREVKKVIADLKKQTGS